MRLSHSSLHRVHMERWRVPCGTRERRKGSPRTRRILPEHGTDSVVTVMTLPCPAGRNRTLNAHEIIRQPVRQGSTRCYGETATLLRRYTRVDVGLHGEKGLERLRAYCYWFKPGGVMDVSHLLGRTIRIHHRGTLV
jgi:hypothetical protein